MCGTNSLVVFHLLSSPRWTMVTFYAVHLSSPRWTMDTYYSAPHFTSVNHRHFIASSTPVLLYHAKYECQWINFELSLSNNFFLHRYTDQGESFVDNACTIHRSLARLLTPNELVSSVKKKTPFIINRNRYRKKLSLRHENIVQKNLLNSARNVYLLCRH